MKTGRAFLCGIIIFVMLFFIGKNSLKEEIIIEPQSVIAKEELRGMWVSTVFGLDFPSSPDLSTDIIKNEINTIVNNASNWGLNAIFFQVRPCSDSFYNSTIYPVSRFLYSDNALRDGFDPLSYFIEACHNKNIKLHAWINPLRVTTGSAEDPSWDTESLPDGHPAKEHPEYVVAYADGKLYYNVGIPEVRQLIADGVEEIIKNYNIDGIHFDDYFYPYPVDGAEFNDKDSYSLYGEGFSVEEYRRSSVNYMVELCYNTVKNYNEKISFGISPQGIWANNETDTRGSNTGESIQSYRDLYADSLYWMEKGIVDYICPQIYWSFEQNGVSFNTVYDWWSKTAKENNIDLYCGLAAYKVGTDEEGWNNEDQLKNQINYIRSGYNNGFILFRYEFLENNTLNLRSSW